MPPVADQQIEARSRVFKAMAHPSRLLMLQKLAEEEQCVCHLQELIGADISTTSKHLAVLKKAGLVEDDKRGIWVYYRLRCPCLTTFLDCVDSVLAKRSTGSSPNRVCQSLGSSDPDEKSTADKADANATPQKGGVCSVRR